MITTRHPGSKSRHHHKPGRHRVRGNAARAVTSARRSMPGGWPAVPGLMPGTLHHPPVWRNPYAPPRVLNLTPPPPRERKPGRQAKPVEQYDRWRRYAEQNGRDPLSASSLDDGVLLTPRQRRRWKHKRCTVARRREMEAR